MNILQQLAKIIGEQLQPLKDKLDHISASGIVNFTQLLDTPSKFDATKRNLKVKKNGSGIEFVNDNMMVDGEFRGMMNGLLHHRWKLLITAGEEYQITNISRYAIVYRTTNNTIRYLRLADEYGQGGEDLYIRIDGGEPTCQGTTNGEPDGTIIGDYDQETNTCFPITGTVVPASNFVGVYDETQSGIASGSYPYSARIRILKTGYYATGWIDVHGMHQGIDALENDLSDAQININNLQADIVNLQQAESSVTAPVYTKGNLPLSGKNSDLALVSDGTITGSPTMSYFYDGSWYRTLDNSLITDQTVDIYLLAGQSNAHGHAKIEYLTDEQKTQDGLFYSSWHYNTSNASTDQYYSNWATSLEAGSTRGDSMKITLGGSNLFGPELGFVARANEINLSDGQPIGVLKHAIGASSLVDDGSEDGGLSDWDLTATGDRRGDALRAFKNALADGLGKLTTAGYKYRLAGMIWWQGESGATTEGLKALIAHMRDHLHTEYTLDMPKEQFPVVITTTTSYWGTHLVEVSDSDSYVGVVNTMDWASPEGAVRTLVHPGSDETYKASQAEVDAGLASAVDDLIGGQDYDGDGVNDMFRIGQAYADQMELAKSGNTNGLWKPDDVELWLDASDTSTTEFSGTSLVSIKDKNSDGSVGSNTFTAYGNIVAGSINGLQTLTFEDDSDDAKGTAGGYGTDYIASGSLANSMSSNNQIWYFVINPANLGADDFDGMFQVNAVTYLSKLKRFYSNNQVLQEHADLLPNSEVSIISIQMNWATSGTNGTTSMWIDGNSAGTPSRPQDTNTNNPLSATGTSAWKFMMYNNGQNFLEGQFCEFIASDVLADREKIEGYLAHKWGIASKLPTDHIYKESAP